MRNMAGRPAATASAPLSPLPPPPAPPLLHPPAVSSAAAPAPRPHAPILYSPRGYATCLSAHDRRLPMIIQIALSRSTLTRGHKLSAETATVVAIFATSPRPFAFAAFLSPIRQLLGNGPLLVVHAVQWLLWCCASQPRCGQCQAFWGLEVPCTFQARLGRIVPPVLSRGTIQRALVHPFAVVLAALWPCNTWIALSPRR